MTILVATPIRKSGLQRWAENVHRIFEALTYADKELALFANECERQPVVGKYGTNAMARNQLLESCLNGRHSHVLWLDADLVEVPPDLIEQLLAISQTDVVAPFVYVASPGDWFYDPGGFVRDGIGAAPSGPIFPDYAGGLIELDSVGTCYLAPAAIYKEHGLRYSVTGDQVEHRYLLGQAKERGYRVLATDAITVTHAYLPAYGEDWH